MSEKVEFQEKQCDGKKETDGRKEKEREREKYINKERDRKVERTRRVDTTKTFKREVFAEYLLRLILPPLHISINVEPTLIQDSCSIFSVHINDEQDGDKMEKRKIEMYIGRWSLYGWTRRGDEKDVPNGEWKRRERDRRREFTSTPLARHSAPDCDIYSPSLTNPILLPPTRFDLAYSLPLFLFLPLVLGSFLFVKPHPRSILRYSNHPSYPFASPFPSTRNSAPPRITLSLSSPPLRFCLHSAMLGLRVAGAALTGWLVAAGRLSPSSVHKKSLCMDIWQKEWNRKRVRESSKSYLCEPFLFLSFLFNVLSRLCKDFLLKIFGLI